MSVDRFARQVGYGVRTHNLDIRARRFLYKGNPPPIINNVHDVAALLRTLPPGIEHPLAFAMNSLQAFSVALHVLHRYVNYKDYEGTSLYQWSTFERPEYGMTVHDYLSVHIEKVGVQQNQGGLQLPTSFRNYAWNQLAVESGHTHAHTHTHTHTETHAHTSVSGRETPARNGCKSSKSWGLLS